ncbi:MAG: MarC family protein [Phycisphaerae bacterium]|nr:MarC family protein [Phycisphaerae bacterium]
MFKDICLAFIPLFVAVDAVGVMPLFVSLTAGLKPSRRDRIIVQSMVTASGLALGFILVGKAVFHALGITIGDFMIAGGVVLFGIAINDLIGSGQRRRTPADELGAVPLGTPMIVGPAVLTTCLVIIPEYGIAPTLIATLLNILLAGLLLKLSSRLVGLLGEAGTKALSKVISLLLAAIAVMLVRKGLEQFLRP